MDCQWNPMACQAWWLSQTGSWSWYTFALQLQWSIWKSQQTYRLSKRKQHLPACQECLQLTASASCFWLARCWCGSDPSYGLICIFKEHKQVKRCILWKNQTSGTAFVILFVVQGLPSISKNCRFDDSNNINLTCYRVKTVQMPSLPAVLNWNFTNLSNFCWQASGTIVSVDSIASLLASSINGNKYQWAVLSSNTSPKLTLKKQPIKNILNSKFRVGLVFKSARFNFAWIAEEFFWT